VNSFLRTSVVLRFTVAGAISGGGAASFACGFLR
jgi:hypothetical protein